MENHEQQVIEATVVIDTLIDHYPPSAEVLVSFSMACVGCVFSRFHTLEDAAVIYQLDPEHVLDALYARLGWSRPWMKR
jgi:hybrid cluster-associated redox disulfide protein